MMAANLQPEISLFTKCCNFVDTVNITGCVSVHKVSVFLQILFIVMFFYKFNTCD